MPIRSYTTTNDNRYGFSVGDFTFGKLYENEVTSAAHISYICLGATCKCSFAYSRLVRIHSILQYKGLSR